MSWLYNHRYQLDGLYSLAEIAFWAVVSLPPEDRDDVEQEIVISLMETIEKYGNKPKSYLKVVARNRFYEYLHKKYQERCKLADFIDGKKGATAGGLWEALHDGDARMDAIATLATLSERLKQIGYKILDGEKLSGADRKYWYTQMAKLRPKLNCRRYANRLSDWEKRRILKLNKGGMSIGKIARAMGRNRNAVRRVVDSQPLSRQDWLAKTKMAAKERDERIRHAYFVERKTVKQIAREFQHSHKTVRGAIYSGAAGTV